MNDVMKMYLKAIGYNKNKKQDKEVVFKKSYQITFCDEYEKYKKMLKDMEEHDKMEDIISGIRSDD